MKTALLTSTFLLLGACSGSGTLETPEPEGLPAERIALSYLGDLAPMLLGRVLSPEEKSWVVQRVQDGAPTEEVVRTALEAWAEDPFLAETARDYVQQTLSVSGQSGDVDFELPGNLARFLVLEERPWQELLTADTCIGGDLRPTDCGTGAPFAAGVLGTRAYLASRASRFNLTRASTMMAAFACQHYPLSEGLEPRLPREQLISMFRADTPEDQENPDVADAFGNGFACYSCHGQFGAHAQFFVRFDETGLWREDATGLQAPDAELGVSPGGLFTSHFADPAEAALPRSQMLGQPAEDLAEAAAILAASPEFLQCTANGVLDYTLRLDERSKVPRDLLVDIAEEIAAAESATFQRILVASLAHPRVIDAATAYLHEADDTNEPTDESENAE